MHEKDIQLARLLIARQNELNANGEALRQQVRGVQERIDAASQAAAERNQYADILARAADLLQRSDLTVDAPDTSAEEAELETLRGQLDELEAQEGQFRELVEQLRQQAPQLFDAATGELSLDGNQTASENGAEEAPETAEAVSSAAPEEATAAADEQGGPEALAAEAPAMPAADSPAATEEADGEDWDESVKVFVAGRQKQLTPEDEEYLSRMPAPSAEPEAAAVSAPDEPLNDDELDRFLGRFNMDTIQRQAIQALAADAVFVVDAASVMNNIPYYDNSIRGGPVKFIRDEMLRDFGLLARHLDRSVHLVLDHEHVPEAPLAARLTLQTLRGGDQGQRAAQDTLLKSVLADAAQRTQVCLVTGELGLGGGLRSRRVQFLPVADFFRM